MKRCIMCCVSVFALSVILSITFVSNVNAQNRVTGTLTVSNETFELKHAYVFEQGDEVAVFMTDNPVSPDNVPYDLGDLAYEGKLHGLSFGVFKSTKQTKDAVYNAIYHKVMLGRGALSDAGKLTIKRFDSEVLEGSLKIDEPGVFECFSCPENPTYIYDVTFKVNLEAK